jgi:hypothetical protein
VKYLIVAALLLVASALSGTERTKYGYKLIRVDANEIGFLCVNGSEPVYKQNGGIVTLNCEN